MDPSRPSAVPAAQGALVRPDGGVEWRIWAPYQDAVTLAVWHHGERKEIPMRRGDASYYHCVLPDVAPGTRYAYRLSGAGKELPDPVSRWQPEGVHRASAVMDPRPFPWRDAGWNGATTSDLVIYECHVGTFTAEGTFEAIIPRLSSLAGLGITALEIMPVGQFPGERNWGYDGVHPFAVQNTYGGPLGLLRLVDAAHQQGLAVILDVVYNHLGPEGNYFGEFGPYFTDRYATPWGRAINYDGPDCEPVRRMVLDNARMWIRDFHIDGLRLDAVHAIYDFGDVHILTDLQAAVQATAAEMGRSALVIAESDRHDFWLAHPCAAGGAGLDGVWNDDFHHAVHALLTGERQAYYADFGEPEHLAEAVSRGLAGPFRPTAKRRHRQPLIPIPPARQRLVICVQNHDQIGNRPRGDRLTALLSPAATRLAAALLLVSPDVPLLFMGEEYGENRPFPFFCSFIDPGLIAAVRRGRTADLGIGSGPGGDRAMDPQAPETFAAAKIAWSWPSGGPQAQRRQWYADLLAIRRDLPELRDRSAVRASLHRLADGAPHRGAVLVVSRGASDQVCIVANLSKQRVGLPPLPPFRWERLLDSEDPRYGGARTRDDEAYLLPFEVQLRRAIR